MFNVNIALLSLYNSAKISYSMNLHFVHTSITWSPNISWRGSPNLSTISNCLNLSYKYTSHKLRKNYIFYSNWHDYFLKRKLLPKWHHKKLELGRREAGIPLLAYWFFLSRHVHALTTLWHHLDAEQVWLCCDQLGYKCLHFSRFLPSLQYVKLKKALNMEALPKTQLHRLDVPDIPRLQTQCSTQYHPDCWNLAELGYFDAIIWGIIYIDHPAWDDMLLLT